MTTAVPNHGGHLTLSHWSTGNQDWSGGPPDRDAVVTVEYVKAYFNSSDAGKTKEWEDGCKDVGAPNATCEIPDVKGPPDGNSSAKTVFLTDQSSGGGNGSKGGKAKSQGYALQKEWDWVSCAMSMLFALGFLCWWW